MFGSLEHGLLKLENGVRLEAHARYAAALKTARCDGQGYFMFRGIPDGTYYVIANVVWPKRVPPGDWSEGDLMQRVEVAGDQMKEILLQSNTQARSPRSTRRQTEIL
jgi:hypothetical protein